LNNIFVDNNDVEKEMKNLKAIFYKIIKSLKKKGEEEQV
jgi:hypothetical protein